MNKEQKVGLFFLGGLVLLFAGLVLTGKLSFLRDTYPVQVDFHDVHGLTPGAEVRVAGIKAGRVAKLDFVEGAVRATIEIDSGITLHEDSRVYLDYQALSGLRFVSMTLGDPNSPRLTPGSVLEGTELGGFTGAFEELRKVGASIREAADSFNENQEQLLTALTTMVDENRRTLSATLANLETITGRVSAGKGTLGLLSTDDALYREMTGAFAAVHDAAANLDVITSTIVEGKGTLGRLLADTALYDEARETMAQLRTSASSIDEIVTHVRNGQGTLGKLLTDDSLYYEAEDAVRSVNRTSKGIEDQTPISIMGTAVGTLF